MKKEFIFSEEFGKIREEYLLEAQEPWGKEKVSFLQRYGKRMAASLFILLLGSMTAFHPKVQAAVREFSTRIGEMFGLTGDLSSYTEIINQTQTQNGISLTLNEVILDEYKLLVSLQGKSSKILDSLALTINYDKTTINEKQYRNYGSISVIGVNPQENAGEDGQMIPNTVLVEEYERLSLPEGDSRVHLVIDVESFDADTGEDKGITAEFTYDFLIRSEEIKAQTIKQTLEETIQGADGFELKLEELSMNALYSRILAVGVEPDDAVMNDYDWKLMGKDSLGNPVSYSRAGFISGGKLLFETSLLGDYEMGEIVDEKEVGMAIPDKECEYLDLQLYARKIMWEDVSETGELQEDETEIVWQEEAVERYEEQENYGWVPVGDKFRIEIERQG